MDGNAGTAATISHPFQQPAARVVRACATAHSASRLAAG